tara:strand:+ start:155 stop:301 length:147 start_codon:yes stop_codon:yes gene_type:complete
MGFNRLRMAEQSKYIDLFQDRKSGVEKYFKSTIKIQLEGFQNGVSQDY